jgi:hypothetical protein
MKKIIILVIANVIALILMSFIAIRQVDNELRIRVLLRQVQALEARIAEH